MQKVSFEPFPLKAKRGDGWFQTNTGCTLQKLQLKFFWICGVYSHRWEKINYLLGLPPLELKVLEYSSTDAPKYFVDQIVNVYELL